MKTQLTKLMIIENYIDWYTTDEKMREAMKRGAGLYVDEDHVDEIAQAGFVTKHQYTTDTEQLKHRLLMVQDDSKCLGDFIHEQKLGFIFNDMGRTNMANCGFSFLNNIQIACDLNDVESLTWTLSPTVKEVDPRIAEVIEKLKELQVDGETMQHIIEEVGMDDQMHRQLVMTKDALDTTILLKEKIDLEVRK